MMIPRHGHDPVRTDDGYECDHCGSVTMSRSCHQGDPMLKHLIEIVDRIDADLSRPRPARETRRFCRTNAGQAETSLRRVAEELRVMIEEGDLEPQEVLADA